MGRLTRALAALAATVVCGCSSTTLRMNGAWSEDLANSLGGYRLPAAELSVQVYLVRNDDAAGLTVAAEPPRVVPGRELFTTSAIFDSAHEDEFTVDVDPATQFLKEISLNSKDKSLDIAKQVGASIGAIASFSPNFLVPKALTTAVGNEAASSVSTAEELVDVLVDPTDPASIQSGNLALWRGVARGLSNRAYGQLCSAPLKPNATRDPTCDVSVSALRDLGLTAVRADERHWEAKLLSLATERPFVQSRAAAPGGAGPGCGSLRAAGRGVCVRAPGQVAIGLSAPAGGTSWQSARLPIRGQEYLLNVQRAMFATKTYDVVFADGFAGKRTISQTSAALAVASVPKVVIDAFIESLGGTTKALSGLLPIRLDYKNARRATASSSSSNTKSITSVGSDGTPTETKTSSISQASQSGADPDQPNRGGDAAKAGTTAGASAKTDASGDAKAGAASDSGKGAAPGAAAASSGPAADGAALATGVVASVLVPPAPILWFAVCDTGLRCTGPLASAIVGTPSPAGAARLLGQPATPDASPPASSRQVGIGAPPAGQPPSTGADTPAAGTGGQASAPSVRPDPATPPCTTPKQLATTACKGKTPR